MGIGMRELIVILLICLVVFGAKKLKTIGTDLGAAVKGFKKGMADGESDSEAEQNAKQIAKEAEDADFTRNAKADAEKKSDRSA
jgi:sec-independent protein translocase protein TatA